MNLEDLTIEDVNFELAEQLYAANDRETHAKITKLLLNGLRYHNEPLTLKHLQFVYHWKTHIMWRYSAK